MARTSRRCQTAAGSTSDNGIYLDLDKRAMLKRCIEPRELRCILALLIVVLIAFSTTGAYGQYNLSYEDEKGDVKYENTDIIQLGVEDGQYNITCFMKVAGEIEDNATSFYYIHILGITVVYSDSYSLLMEADTSENWTCKVNGSRLDFVISFARLNQSGINHDNFDLEGETHYHENGSLLVDYAGKDHVPDIRSELDKLMEDVCGLGMLATMSCLIGVVLFFALWAAISMLIYRDARRRGDPMAMVWALLILFMTFFGLAAYLVMRKRVKRQRQAPDEYMDTGDYSEIDDKKPKDPPMPPPP
jgi:hypothetical protein